MWNNLKEKIYKILSTRILWKTLFVALIAIGFVFLSVTLYTIFSYLRLNHKTEARVEKFEILSSSKGGAQVCLVYHYSIKNNNYQKQECLKNFYLNSFTAREDIEKRLLGKKWIVFYNKNYPENATIQKKFPSSLVIRTTLIFLISLYFWVLSRYIKKKYS
jgi:hypothetical protein